MRNFVAKNNHNRSSVHCDKKNDYTRNWDLDEELSLYDRRADGGDIDECKTDGSEEDCQ